MKKQSLKAIFMAIVMLMSVVTISAQDFNGTLTDVTMNGKKFNDVPNSIFTLENNYNGTYRLKGEVKQIGKMPGWIELNIPVTVFDGVVEVNRGVYSDPRYMDVGTLHTKLKNIKLYLTSLQGTRKDGKLHFVLKTFAGYDKFKMFPASVTFDGTEL